MNKRINDEKFENRFAENISWLNNTLNNNNIRCEKLTTIVLGGSKIRSMILRQAKTGKHKCGNVTAIYKMKYSGKILIY